MKNKWGFTVEPTGKGWVMMQLTWLIFNELSNITVELLFVKNFSGMGKKTMQ